MAEKWIDVKICPLCGTNGFMDAGTATRTEFDTLEVYGTFAPLGIVVRYLQCLYCGMIFQSPRMSDKDLENFYSSGAYRRFVGKTITQKRMDEMEREQAVRISNFIFNLNLEAPKRILDVGASRGYLLSKLKAKYPNAYAMGIEPYTDYVESGNMDTLEDDILFAQDGVDLITCVHVLEHVAHPLSALIVLKSRLTHSGTLVIEVPSLSSPGGSMRLPHVLVFQPWTLRALLERAGLKLGIMTLTPHILVTATK